MNDDTATEETPANEPEPPPGRGKPVAYWVANLRDPDDQMSREAMAELVRMGQPAVGPVIEVLKDPDEVNRARAQSTLSRIGAPAVPELVTALSDEKAGVGVVVILAKIGSEALPALNDALGNDDVKVRRSACLALREIGEPGREAAKSLAKALKDMDAKVRSGAAAALARTGAGADEIPNLMDALQDAKDGELRANAARALGKIGSKADKAVPVLVAILGEDANAEARAGAAAALGLVLDSDSVPKGVIPALRVALGDAKAEVREEAANALGTLRVQPKGVVSDLALALQSEKVARVRKTMAWALGQFGRLAAPAVTALAELLKDKDAEARLAAVSALEKIGEPALPVLARAIRSPHDDVRKAALDALAKSNGTGAEEAVPALTEALKSEDPQVREGAVIILGKLGPAAKAAVAGLGDALEDTNVTVRLKAAEALGKIGKSAVPVLAKALKSDNEEVRSLAAHGLGESGEAARSAAPALAELVADKKAGLDARKSAAYALSRAGAGLKVPVQPLVDALLEKTTGKTQPEIEATNDFRRHISVALANIGAPAVGPLVETLSELNPFIRQYVREALGKIGKPAVAALIDALKSGTSFPVRSGAIAALGEIGPDAKSAVPELTKSLQDPDRGIGTAAKDALKKINKGPAGSVDNGKE